MVKYKKIGVYNKKGGRLKMLKKVRGITLIALVVTIIILLILATVTITTVTGQNGLFKRVSDAKTATEIAKEKETISTAYMTVASGNADANVKSTELNGEINNELNGETATVEGKDNGPFYITYNKSGRKYTIDSNGQTETNISEDVNPTKIAWPGWPRSGDEGTESNPYKIYCIEDLASFAKQSNSGNDFSGKYITINANLDFDYNESYYDSTRTDFGDINGDGTSGTIMEELTTSNGWMPIAKSNSSIFTGSLNGQDNTIANLYISRSSNSDQGFIGYAKNNEIKNIKLSKVNVLGKRNVGGIIAEVHYSSTNYKITNCSVTGNIKNNNDQTGGIVGYINTSNLGNAIEIQQCKFDGNILGNSASGGILGNMTGYEYEPTTININNCEARGNINGYSYAGGISGGHYDMTSGTISNCTNYMNINMNTRYAGGIVATLESSCKNITISNCINNGNISGIGYLGGIEGGYTYASSSTIENCLNKGLIKGIDYNTSYNGGIISKAEGITIKNCSNVADVYGGTYVGGISGIADSNITNCYNIANVYGRSEVGGINGNGGNVISNCYNLGKIEAYPNIDPSITLDEFGGISGIGTNSIENCYSNNTVSGNIRVGGITGYSPSVTMTNSFYLYNAKYKGNGYNDVTDAIGVVESVSTDSDMKSKIIAYFKTQDGWAEDTNNINNGYPILTWQK